MKNFKKSASLGLTMLMAATMVAPTMTFAAEPEAGDKNPAVVQPADEKKDEKEKTPEEIAAEELKTEKEAFGQKIAQAEAAKKDIVVAKDAKEVNKGIKFVTEEGLKALDGSIAKAKEAANKEDATVETLKAAGVELDKAVNDFKALVKEGEKEVKPETKEEKIARLEKEIATLKAKLATAGSEKAALEAKIKELQAEVDALKGVVKEQKVNKLFLERVYGTLKSVKKDSLIKADQDRLVKLLADTEAVYKNEKATQKEVDQAASNVLDFLYTAKYEDAVADTRELKKVLDDAKKIKERDVARRDWSDLQKLIKEADSILADRKSSQRDVDNMRKDLDKLIREIIDSRLDIKDLDKLVTEANKLDIDKFTRRDRYEFEKMLDEAKSLLRDPSATQRDIDRAYDNLKGFLKDVAKDGGELAKDINKMLNKAGDVDVEKALSKIRSLFNLPVVETKTIDSNAKLSSLRYVFTINSEKFAEVTNKAINVYRMDTAPFIQNDRTMVPLRFAAYTLQADVSWDQATKTATFTKNGTSAYVTIGSTLVKMSNGQNFNMDTAPVMKNDRMHVSIANVAKMFGETQGLYGDKKDNTIEWDSNNKAVVVYVAR